MSFTLFMRKVLTIFTLLFFISAPVWADITGKIAGSVYDVTTDNSIPGANILIDGTQMGGATDEDGDYFIINIPPGTYTIRAVTLGYKALVQTDVVIVSDRTTVVNFALEESIIEGETITVISERPTVDMDVTGSENIINAQSLALSPVQNLSDALKQQTGIYNTGETAYVRGGLSSEVTYNLDGASLNSGVLSDNWTGLNTSAMQEVSLLTGGYNAEYGNAMSGVVNIVSKEASRSAESFKGSLKYRVRPAGQYHWGPNMYSKNLWKSTNYDMAHWQGELQDANNQAFYAQYFQRFYGWNGTDVPSAQQLADTYQEQITPESVLGDYADRAQHDYEGTVYGPITENLNFLISGRYLKGVNIFPQSQAYNPEWNFQGNLNYYPEDNMKLSLNLLHGGYNSATYTQSNWNNMESSQEARWQPNSDVRDPYTAQAYAPWGGYWLKGPQEKRVNSASLKFQHTLDASTFYTLQVSYLRDDVTELQDYDQIDPAKSNITHTADLDQVRWGDSWFDLGGNFRLAARQIQVNNYSTSDVISGKADFTSQWTKNHQIKAGVDLKVTDINYEHYYMEFPAGDVWHLDNVFDGTPFEGAMYLQDKMEFKGLTLNVGLRVDGFNAMNDYAANIYDPLGFQTWNGGDGVNPSNTASIWQANDAKRSWFAEIDGVTTDYQSAFTGNRSDQNKVESEWKVAIAPRLGLSFPITETSKLRFNYGHFYQRPSWAKILGFPTSWFESDPYGSVRMDQWQGYYGQPGVDYEKTIQYEIGYDQSFLDIIRFSAAAYYKDASQLTRFSHNSTYNRSGGGFAAQGWGSGNFETYSRSRNIANDGHDNIFYTNNAFKDIRGFEVKVEKMFGDRWHANLNMDFSWNSGGAAGFATFYEDDSRAQQPHTYDEQKVTWLANTMLKAGVTYITASDLVSGILGDISVGMFHEYFSGPEYTYYPLDHTGLQEPNNKNWFPHNRTDLKLSKRFPISEYQALVSFEVYNLFNNFDRVLLGGEELINWEENGEKPKHWLTGEARTWDFYNAISNPKRMMYFSLGLEF